VTRFDRLGLRNRRAIPLSLLPVEEIGRFRDTVGVAVRDGWRLTSFFGFAENAGTRLLAILADDAGGRLGATSTVVQDSFPSLTPYCPQAHQFEREIAEQCGVVPEGHP
jgi:hypothetical protein